MTNPENDIPFSHIFRVADLPARKATRFDLAPDAAALARMTEDLGLLALRKVRLKGTLAPAGKRDWRLVATLGATVVQPCVLTTDPVTTRLEENVSRLYTGVSKYPTDNEAIEIETEMPEDDTVEDLGTEIDVGEVLTEALALALPLYPRSTDAELGTAAFTEPGKTPMRDEEALPFAGLSALRDKLNKDDTPTD
ncbi:YceD family protein [Pseudogemmobacter sp. W21_MBD1_M6]|uniref:YceD family protein n=1 Tax=Pseudogemmobacter sp. W21_MBD1_M6 TaxID=3240271 RepID=UPI003F9D1CFD